MKKTFDDPNEFYEEAQDRMLLLPNYYFWIYKIFSKYIKGNVIEIGSGEGHFIPHYLNKVDSVCALDFNKKLLEKLNNRINNDKVSIMQFDLRDKFKSEIIGKYDTVIALDVLEHIEDDYMLLTNLKSILQKNGFLLIKVPAQSSLFGNSDIASGHYRRYDLKQFKCMMDKLNMKEIKLKYINKTGSCVYKLKRQNNLNFSKNFKPESLKVFNHFIPFISFIDKAIPCKGLSLVGIYQKNK